MFATVTKFYIRIAVTIVGLNMAVAHADTSLKAQFHQGNVYYQNENYAAAIDAYTAILAQQQSANLHYNLGNAYFKTGDYGLAILHYRKARILDPRNPEFKANLQFAIDAADVNHPANSWLDNYAYLMQVNTWTWLATALLWISIALAVLPRYFKCQGILPWVLCCTTSLMLGLCLIGLYGYHSQRNDAVVVVPDAPIKVAPAKNVQPKSFLANAEFATISRQQGDYYLIRTFNGQSGFIRKEDLRKIW